MTTAEQIEIACLMEATARKPGNVHPAASFDDLTYSDFVRAAEAIAQPIAALAHLRNESLFADGELPSNDVAPAQIPQQGQTVTQARGASENSKGELGNAIYHAVRATREATGTNVNLGIVLLLAPLAAVPAGIPLEEGISIVLRNTTSADAEFVYAAIRLAVPGGMGNASSQDIDERPTVTLREAMQLAVDRDRIAEQYCTDYRLVFEARRKLAELMQTTDDWEAAVVVLHLWMMSHWPDTLIARKCGWDTAHQSSVQAAAVLSVSSQPTILGSAQLAEFDHWLRADGHRRNPGTTADLIAATLFAAMRDGLIPIPSRSAIRDRANFLLTAFTEKTL